MAGNKILGFNPRTRESATSRHGRDDPHPGVSIHALVRVRPKGDEDVLLSFKFQSTHS